MIPTRKTYTEEFKREAVELMEKSGNKSRTARDLGIHISLLKKWQQKIQGNAPNPFPGKGNPSDGELASLRKENARLREENSILKKAVGIFTNRSQ